MEMNKDEALRCCDIAARLLREGDYARAEKFVQKSLKLFPTEQAGVLARRLQREASSEFGATGTTGGENNDTNTSNGTSNHASENGSASHKHPSKDHSQTNGNSSSSSHAKAAPRSSPSTARKSTSASASASASATPSAAKHTASAPASETKSYTAEQAVRVKEILRKKCLYERLSVSRDASKGVIKKAYYKLALEFHPDKNTAPGADEAFKAISKAFDILNDDAKRRQYDVTGDDEPQVQQQRHPGHHEMTPEELFAHFFGANVFQQQPRRRGNMYTRQTYYEEPRGEGHNNNNNDAFNILQIFFALILVLIMTSSFLSPTREPMYTLRPMGPYVLKQTLPHLPHIEFYVKDTFAADTRSPATLSEVYRDVEQHYLGSATQGCARARYAAGNEDCQNLERYRKAKEELRMKRSRG
eukprot:m.97383 g.97383  ORF g.97383 m.97383 type:complete len:416 (-) comp15527_c1_seq1:1454-2701(-)